MKTSLFHAPLGSWHIQIQYIKLSIIRLVAYSKLYSQEKKLLKAGYFTDKTLLQ